MYLIPIFLYLTSDQWREFKHKSDNDLNNILDPKIHNHIYIQGETQNWYIYKFWNNYHHNLR